MINDIVPLRPIPPDETKWVTVETNISTPHPYSNNEVYTYTIPAQEGYTLMRIHFKKLETEAKYDVVSIPGKKYSGRSGEFFSKPFMVEGPVEIKLVTDNSSTAYGFDIDFVQVQ